MRHRAENQADPHLRSSNFLALLVQSDCMQGDGTDLRFGSAFDRLSGSAVASCSQRGDETVCLSVLFSRRQSFRGRRCCSVSCSQRADEMRPIAKSEPDSIFWRAPPNSGSFLGLFPTGCAKPSSSLSCSSDEPCRHGPCSSFRSSEEPHAGFTTVLLRFLT